MARFKPRISLQMFLLVFTALAVGLGLEVARSQRQQSAVAELKSAIVIWDYQLPDGQLASWDPTLEYDGPRWLVGPSGKGLFSRVRGLILMYGVSSETFERLPDLPHLESLNLSGSGIDDDGLVFVARLRQLQTLNLESTGVTDAGLAHVSKLKFLEHLSLNYTGVTDVGMERLAVLSKLQTLNLEGTAVTSAGVEKLKTRFPDCKIAWGLTSTPQGEPTSATPKR